MAINNVTDLYREILGREPDAGGLEFWQQGFGDTIDSNEIDSFKTAAQSELANRSSEEQALLAPKIVNPTSTGVSDADILGWFNANPGADDALIAKTMKEASVTPEQVARATSSNYENVNNRYLAATAPTSGGGLPAILQQDSTPTSTPKATSFAQQYLDANPDVKAEFELFKKQEPNKWTPESYASYHYGNYGMNENRAGAEGLSTNINNLASQILGQNLTSKWSGEGFGSAEKNAADMANILTSIGITNIKDFGKIEKQVPRYSYDDSGNQTLDGYDTVTTYGNVKTGQEVPNTYGERQVDNAFGGTFKGKGNTGYRVKFAPDGTPIFYTTEASSNDLVNLFADDPILGAIAQIGAAYFGGPAGTAALNAAMGKDLGDIAKSTVMSYLGNQALQGLTDTGIDTNVFGETGANLATDIKDIFGKTGSELIGKTAGQFVANEGNIDIGSLLVNQGVGAATNAVLGQIPDFKTLDPILQKLVTRTVSNTLSGNPGLTPAQIVSTALNEGLKASKSGVGLSAEEQAQVEANREIKRLNRIEDAVLNQPASDDGTTQGILDLIDEMYPAADIKGMSQGDLAKFLEANMDEIQGSADLETLFKSAGEKTADEGTVTVTGDRPTGLGDFMLPTSGDEDLGTVVVTGNRENDDYVPSIRTKDIVSDIQDVITPEDIATLFPDLKIEDILQTVIPNTKTTVTPTKTVTPAKTTDPLLAILGLGGSQQAPSQDPYANIKSMEDLFGGDIAYKLRALGVPKNLASADLDALARLLRG
jgi:hypothetical protein